MKTQQTQKFILLFLALILNINLGFGQDLTPLSSVIVVNSNLKLNFQIDGSDIYIMVEAIDYGWVAFGFNKDMFDTDMVVFETDNSKATVTDRYSSGHSTPSIDSQKDWSVVGSDIQSGSFKIKVKRALDTKDSKDKVFVEGESYEFCAAWSKNKKLSQHDSGSYKSFKVELKNDLGNLQAVTISTGVSEQALDVHKKFLFYGWGIGVDVSIFFARYLKTWKHYINVHAFLFFALNVGTIVLEAIVIDGNKSKIEKLDKIGDDIKNHFIIGCVILGMVILQHIGGIFLKFSIEGHNKRVQTIKRFHQIFGMGLYILCKANLLIGSDLDSTLNDGVIITVISMSFLVFAEIFNRIYLQKTRHQIYDYSYAKTQIEEPKDLISQDHASLLKMLNEEQRDIQQIIAALPHIKWVVFNQGVYDITDFVHPGGQYIMKDIVGKEIGRYLLGSLPLEGYNFKPHQHSASAIKYLKSKLIGYLNYKDTNIFEIEDQESDHVKGKLRVFTSFKIAKVEKISNTTSKFHFQSETVKVKNILKGINWIGRHFQVKVSNKSKSRLYTQMNCMTDENINLRNQLVGYAQKVQAGEMPQQIDTQSFNKYSSTLPLIIKKYNFNGALSKTIHDENSSKEYSIQGPLGTGLNFGDHTVNQRICIICVGTGVLPFLDLFDFLLKKQLQESLPTHKQQLDPFNLEYSKYFKGCSFSVFTGFPTLDDFIGREWIFYLNQLSKQSGNNLFNLNVKLSNGQLPDGVNRITERSYGDYIDKNIDSTMFEKVYICGPPQMFTQIIESLTKKGFDQQNIFNV